MSKESAISYIMGYDKTETKEEINKIKKETVDAYAQNNTNIVYEDEDNKEENNKENNKEEDNNEDKTE